LQKSKLYKTKKSNLTERKTTYRSQLFKGLCKQAHEKCVLKAVRDNCSSGWNEKGNFIVDGKVIPHSDIKKLLLSAVRYRDSTLPGWNEFNSLSQWQSL